MNTLLLFAAVVLTARPALLQTTDLLNTGFLPQQQQQQQSVTKVPVPAILRLQSDGNPDGTFTYTFETENGISAHAESTLTRSGDPEESIQSVRGQYSYTGPDGVQYTVEYIADHNGYQAFGSHLPTPPPIPDAILRSLEHNAAHPEEDAPATTRSEPVANPANPTAAHSTRSPAPPTVSKTLPLAQTQVLQPQQLQVQQPQQLQISVQPQQLQPQQLQPQQLQPQQFQTEPQQFQTQLQPQQLQVTQLQPQQLQSRQLQFAQLQSRQLQPQQQLQPQDFLTQFAPSFQTLETQRRVLTNVK